MVWKSLKRYLGQFRIVHLNPASSTVGFFYFIKMAKEIQLTQGKVAIVDDEDFDYLNQFKWFSSNMKGKFYAVRTSYSNEKCSCILMHREIMKPIKGYVIDHIDGNPLDNQKKNLRICTVSQNSMNRNKTVKNKSGFKGVYWHKLSKKWASVIKIDNKALHLGLFLDAKEAAKTYNAAALKYHGEFANLNKID